MTISRMALAVALASTPSVSFAQDTDAAANAPTLSASASGPEASPTTISTAPLTGTILRGDSVRARAVSSSDTAAIVAALPGMSASGGGGFSSMPALRGLSEQRARVTVDNVAIDAACPNDMNSPLSYTDPQTVASIAVVPGVSPVSMGGDTIAGVIAVESAMPRFSTSRATLVEGETSTFYRSNGNGLGGALRVTVAGRDLSVTYAGSYTRSENYQGGGTLGTVRSSEYAKSDHALSIAARTSAGQIEVKGGYHHAPYEGFPNQWMDMTSNRSWFVTGRYRGAYRWGDVDLTASYRGTDHEMNFLADKLPGDMPMNTESHSFTSALKLRLPVSSRDTLRLGGDLHRQWLNDWWPPVAGSTMMGPDTYLNVNGGTRDRWGLFGEWERQWSGSLATSAGVRFDQVRTNAGPVQPYGTGMMQAADVAAAAAFNAADRRRLDGNWSATVLASWQASEAVALELGYAHKTRSPNLYERYSWGRRGMSSQMIGWYGDGNGYVGNPNLKPERADTVSAALRLGAAGGARLKLSPYYTHVADYIDAVFLKTLGGGFVQLRFANQQAEVYGLDASATLPLFRRGAATTSLTAQASWQRGENLSDGGALYHQMPFNAQLAIDHASGPVEAGAELEYVAEKTRVDATRNEPRTAAHALFNLRLSYTLEHVLKGVKLTAEARNLFDAAYGLPLGGVSLGDYGVTGKLRPVPGQGRSLNLMVGTKF